MQRDLSDFISLTNGKLLRIPLAMLSASLIARTIGPDDAEDFPFVDVKVKPIDRIQAAEALLQVVDLKKSLHLRPPLLR